MIEIDSVNVAKVPKHTSFKKKKIKISPSHQSIRIVTKKLPILCYTALVYPSSSPFLCTVFLFAAPVSVRESIHFMFLENI